MRKIFTLLAAILLMASGWAQSPQKMSYQAVIRDATNHLVTTQIGMQISILQGTSTGTAVYIETQTPTPNVNGLVTIEINGLLSTVTFGTFSAIDWSAGPYFIKTEIATAAPLTTYTITSTSQILSVPYALYAKTAASYTETDPVYAAWDKSTGISITASQVSDFQSNVTNNTAVLANTAKNSYPPADATKLAGIDGSETIVTAGTNVTVTGSGTSGSPYVVNASGGGGGGFTHYIGELYGGGIVVSVWKTSGTEHGLIASLVDISAAAAWSDVTGTSAGAISNMNGLANTTAILAQSATAPAALACTSYTGGSNSDWYLPSIWELKECYDAGYIVNTILGATDGFKFAAYWSSTENSSTDAWYLLFNTGVMGSNAPKGNNGIVRAVRKF